MTAPAIDSASLTRLTVNCTPKAIAALETVTDLTGDSKTDTVNRALQLYAELVATPTGSGFSYENTTGAMRHVWVTDTEPRRRSFTFRFFWWGRRRSKPDVS